ncbi:MarR family winged helix-turn-helix transcriptional regulator [Motilibacter aurantiacus]|uniref:MarR family winged helix-turn-helix transcriptional regulator n=1 Tax=Motilibacter aurantiacus TaxID=2714955 RepID=UPI00140E3B7F|nr:MarR family winged helix-turn-helix transcriptional regulator [Motilibacter aurantiacus]NHC45818.1 winged helix-turn-helix transcriptional regulator [Motilibacter aurantiacus]
MPQPTDCRPAPPGADAGDVIGDALLRAVRALKGARGSAPVDGPCLGVLHAISTRGPVRPGDVAAEIALDASTVSRHVQSLERLGLVGRERDPADGRAHRVAVTSAGDEALDSARDARRAVLDAALAGWEAADRERLAGLLARLADELTRPSAPAPTGENR